MTDELKRARDALPPMPVPYRVIQDADGFDVQVFRVFQMRDYARAAIAAADAVLTRPAQADPWKQAIDDELVSMAMTADSYATPRDAVKALIDWHCSVQIDPAVSSAAQALIEQGRKEVLSKPMAPLGEVAIDAWRLRAVLYDADGEPVGMRDPEPHEIAAALAGARKPVGYVNGRALEWLHNPDRGTNAHIQVGIFKTPGEECATPIYAAAPPAPDAQALPPVLVRDLAEVIGNSVPNVCDALRSLGRGERSTNMAVSGEECLAVAKHLRAAPDAQARDAARTYWLDVVYTLMGHAAGLYAQGQHDMPRWFYELAEKIARTHVDDVHADRVREVASRQRAMYPDKGDAAMQGDAK